MSDLLSLTAKTNLDIVKIELIYNGSSYKVMCTCRITVLGTSVDEVVVPLTLNQDLKLHVDMFSSAVRDHLERR